MSSRSKVAIVFAVALLVFAFVLMCRACEMRKLSEAHGAAPFPMEEAEKLSVDELVQRAEGLGEIVLPSWMPGDVKLREIYFKGLAILVYSDRQTRDYREDNVTIQISTADVSPSLEDLKRLPGEVVRAGDFLAVIYENPAPDPWMEERGVRPILAEFFHDGFEYLVTGIKGQVTRDDMVRIIASMKPLGADTLRKE